MQRRQTDDTPDLFGRQDEEEEASPAQEESFSIHKTDSEQDPVILQSFERHRTVSTPAPNPKPIKSSLTDCSQAATAQKAWCTPKYGLGHPPSVMKHRPTAGSSSKSDSAPTHQMVGSVPKHNGHTTLALTALAPKT